MLRRVRIKSVPKARTGYQVHGALANDVPAFGGADYNAYIGEPDVKIKRTISAVPRDEANLEAEGGETVVGNLDGSMIPSFKKIVGPRHSQGGVPLNLPDDSFIFSDTKSMMIKDPHILKMFNKPEKKGGYTPAELSKKFDINKYRQILQDPNSDKIDRKTAELMIKNCVLKLGALALAQEAKKSFPQGVPEIAKPYMQANGISEEDLIPKKPEEQQQMPQQEMGEGPEMEGMGEGNEAPMQMPNGQPVAMPQEGMAQMGQPEMEQEGMEQMAGMPMAMYGAEMGNYEIPSYMAYGGYIPEAQEGMNVDPISRYIADNMNKPGIEKPAITDEQRIRLDAMEAMQNADWYNAPTGMSKDRFLEDGKIQKMNTWYPGLATKKSGVVYRRPNQYQVGGGTDTTSLTPEEQKIVDTKWNGKTDAYLAYKAAEEAIRNDPDFRKKLFDQYQKVIDQEANYTRGKKTNWNQALKDRKEEEVVDALLQQEERNARLEAFGLNALESDQGTAKGKNVNKQASELIANTPGLSDLNFDKGYLSQAAYLAYDDVIKGGEDKQRGIKQTGKSDELKGRESISGIDNASTNTTLGQRLNYTKPEAPAAKGPCQCEDATKTGYQPKDKDGNCTCPGTEEEVKCECINPETGATYDPGKDAAGNCIECAEAQPEQPAQRKPAEWWLQDTINTAGAFGDLMGVKKYMPWEARVDLEEPRPVFLDPTRELAAQSEQANIASQAAAQFAGPQALNSRLSQIQGQGAKGAADTLNRINNQNVNIANQFEANQVGIRNQEQAMNQQMAGRVYDKNVISNQQFDNAKRQIKKADLRESYKTALTNRAKTDALNQMYPNYQVDPSSGGMVNYTPTKKTLDPSSVDADIFEYRNKLKAAGWTEKEITAEMARKFGKKFGGAIYSDGGGVYVMGDKIFPFTS
jgi:hypothetical protein